MGYNRPYFCKMAKTKNNALSYKIKKIRRPNYQELRSNVEYYSPLETELYYQFHINLTYRKIDIMEVMLKCLNGQDCKITKN